MNTWIIRQDIYYTRAFVVTCSHLPSKLPSLNGCYLHIIKNFIIKKIKIADDKNGDFDGYDVLILLDTDTETDLKMRCVELLILHIRQTPRQIPVGFCVNFLSLCLSTSESDSLRTVLNAPFV